MSKLDNVMATNILTQGDVWGDTLQYLKEQGYTDPGYKATEGLEFAINKEVSKGGRMLFSGYASTKTVDLSGEVVLPSSFEKHLWRYQRNPVVCFQHDRNTLIGKALNVEITDKGIWMDMELAPIPIVKDTLWTLIEGEYLKQMSIGFLGLDGKQEKDFFMYTEAYLLENSVVTVACNPDAEIGVQKALATVKSLDDLIRLKETGELVLTKNNIFHMPNNPLENKEVDEVTQNSKEESGKDMAKDVVEVVYQATDSVDTGVLVSDGITVDKVEGLPPKVWKQYTKFSDQLFLAKKGNAYYYRLGDLVSAGNKKFVQYNFKHVAASICYLFNAKGGSLLEGDEKVKAVEKLKEVYELLEKEVPTIKIDEVSVSLFELDNETLAETKFHDIEFNSGETVLFQEKLIGDSFNFINSTPKALMSDPTIKDTVAKCIIATFSIWGCIDDQEDVDTLNQMLSILVAAEEAEVPEMGGEAPVYALYEAPDGVAKEDESHETPASKFTDAQLFAMASDAKAQTGNNVEIMKKLLEKTQE